MTQEEFRKLLKRYKENTATPEEKELIEKWYAAIGKNSHTLITSEAERELEEKYWNVVSDHIRLSRGKASNRRVLSHWNLVGIAASVLIAVVSTFYLYSNKNSRTTKSLTHLFQREKGWLSLTSDETPNQVILTDGTSVILQPFSHLRYNEDFGVAGKREVFLEGEGFFHVSPDPDNPFFVHSGEVVTKVLGTSFTVKAYPDDTIITVEVKTGTVSIITQGKGKSKSQGKDNIIITPNEKIVYNREENIVVRSLVENPQPLIPRDEVTNVRFEETPVADIFQAVEKIYGVEIVFDETIFSGCTLTTSIEGGVFSRLDIICKAIGATYLVEGTQIKIMGQGCN